MVTVDDPTLASLGADVAWPDADSGRVRATGTPTALDNLAAWLAGAQGTYPPRNLGRVRALLFGTDQPGAGVLSVAELVGARVHAVPAVTDAPRVTDAVRAAVALVDAAVDEGADLLVVGAVGSPEACTAAAVCTAVLTDTEPVKVLPRGTAMDPAAWIQRAVAVRDGRRAAVAAAEAPDELAGVLADPVIAAMSACLLRAGARRTPVLIDGPVVAAAALLAHRVQPRVSLWLRAADRGQDPVQTLALDRVDLAAVLDLGTDGSALTAGLLAVSVARAAVLQTRSAHV